MALSILEFSNALKTLEESLGLFKKAAKQSPEQVAFRDASIQRFEYCIEMAWKLSMKALGSNTAAAKPAIREMARNNLINDPNLWLDFIEARNNSSHSYDENVAAKVFKAIEGFLPEAKEVLAKLSKMEK